MRFILVSRIAIFVTGGLMLASLLPLSQPYRHSSAWQVPIEHRQKVELALMRGAQNFGMSSEEYRQHTRPHIEDVEGQTCIRLETHRSDGGGSYTACYDHQGSISSERASGTSFGAETLWDRFGHWVW